MERFYMITLISRHLLVSYCIDNNKSFSFIIYVKYVKYFIFQHKRKFFLHPFFSLIVFGLMHYGMSLLASVAIYRDLEFNMEFEPTGI